MYNKIYVFSPTTQATGGTELLQQLVYKLRVFGQNAVLFYSTKYQSSPVQKVFEPRYSNPFVDEIEDVENNLMIVSESSIYYLLKYHRIQKAVWWLSVDFYGGSFRLPTDVYHKIFYFLSDQIYSCFDKKWIHLVQSEYAYRYCFEERHIPSDRIYRLSDFLSKAFIESGLKEDDSKRNNVVLYNPKKGLDFTKKIMSESQSLTWVPIQNMTSVEIADLMKHSKVYVDFGNHPGKDRIPREAAINGCCVITGLRGAAKNSIDIPIPDKYKFSESQIKNIIDAINFIFANYSVCKHDYSNYVKKIISEEIVFEKEVKEVFINNSPQKMRLSFGEKLLRMLAKPIVFTMKFGPKLFGHK